MSLAAGEERLYDSRTHGGIDPRTWMEDVLKRLPEYELGNGDLSELLPRKLATEDRNCPVVPGTTRYYQAIAATAKVIPSSGG